ncbi:hypothetical protein [Planomonospora venezuelensis]|uniref:Uncharacterized protein n=1 Tax=Planomonospora venezuelensis TaxID=1999 RepID=A0A841D691_PLAVE|nr:hypothetical protein [Planomonospora venezuelensis]MBB5966162.1 hypothetical protein [Planomonospora venezuelensis]GIN05807.1 hypothetical protein Pve01_74650 [Planomonospora venezuelensis]
MTEPGRDEPQAPHTPQTAGLGTLARLLGAVVAPTSLLTALLYFFGWNHTHWLFHEFGVNATVLGFSATDYLVSSQNVLFVPLTVAALAGLAALWAHAALRARITDGTGPRLLRYAVPAMLLVGLVLMLAGIASIFTATVLERYLAVPPLCLALGVLLLAYARRLRSDPAAGRPGVAAVTEWAIVFLLVAISLFWAVGDYAAAAGRTRAHRLAARLDQQPSAVLYSESSLSLAIPGVRETPCRDGKAAYRFRYDGLKLIVQSADQYVFLPETWNFTDGVAVLLPRSPKLRLEFLRAGRPAPAAPTC